MSSAIKQPADLARLHAVLSRRRQQGVDRGFEPRGLPPQLFAFQRDLVAWAVRRGRAAIFADCGLGKSAMTLAWADQVVRHSNRPVLLLTPLAVGPQFVREGERFGTPAARSLDGTLPASPGIVVANYERLAKFDPADFAGVACDESSILKSFKGETRKAITAFMRQVPYRLLATATAAPNDHVELGTSAEALGETGVSGHDRTILHARDS